MQDNAEFLEKSPEYDAATRHETNSHHTHGKRGSRYPQNHICFSRKDLSLHDRNRCEGAHPVETSYDSRRNQYYSTTILKTLRGVTRLVGDRILGVTDADLFVPGLNFVFGEADASTGVAVISITRLRQEFYGLRRNTRLFHARAVKEGIHELGHTCGLGHCRDPHCIMHFSNSLRDTDEKGPEFCALCKKMHDISF